MQLNSQLHARIKRASYEFTVICVFLLVGYPYTRRLHSQDCARMEQKLWACILHVAATFGFLDRRTSMPQLVNFWGWCYLL